MEGQSSESSNEPKSHMRGEDFLILMRNLMSESESDEITSGPTGIMDQPSRIMNGQSGIMSGSSRNMNGPCRSMMKLIREIMREPNGIMSSSSGIMSEKSGIMNGPSRNIDGPMRRPMMGPIHGIMHEPNGIMSSSSKIMMPEARTSSFQVGNPDVGVIPRPPLHFLQDLQVEPKTNVQIYPDGTVTNISPTMMTDQFGMIGCLSARRGMFVDSSLATLTIGYDPVNIGLGMNSQLIVPDPDGNGRREIHRNYGGPWADRPNHAPHIETEIPEVYRTNLLIGDKLVEIKFQLLQDELLFYIFYNFPREEYQIAAAYELYERDWRYHKMECIWLTRLNYNCITVHTKKFEKGIYNVFDPIQWRKRAKAMTLEYKDLEKRPKISPNMEAFFDL